MATSDVPAFPGGTDASICLPVEPFSSFSTSHRRCCFRLPLLSSAPTCFHLFSQMTSPSGSPSLIIGLIIVLNVRTFQRTFLSTLLLQGRLLIHLWAAVQCNTVDIRELSQVDLKNGLKLMVLANKWHSLISGKICLRGQLAGGHHTRSEPPGCSGRTRKVEKRPSRQGARQETCCTYWSLFPLTGNAWCERRVWSLDFGQRWAISVPVGPFQCVFMCGMCALVHVPI